MKIRMYCMIYEISYMSNGMNLSNNSVWSTLGRWGYVYIIFATCMPCQKGSQVLPESVWTLLCLCYSPLIWFYDATYDAKGAGSKDMLTEVPFTAL